jgi:hypothetical protein
VSGRISSIDEIVNDRPLLADCGSNDRGQRMQSSAPGTKSFMVVPISHVTHPGTLKFFEKR